MIKLQIKEVRESATMPTQAHSGDMIDVYAAEDVVVNSFESTIIPLGIAMNIPEGYRIKLFSRSSLPLKKKIVVSNSVGIIDTGYKNELGLICHSLPCCRSICVSGTDLGIDALFNNPVKIYKGDKIAQFQLEKIVDFELEEVKELDMSNDRGGGYGSTGN